MHIQPDIVEADPSELGRRIRTARRQQVLTLKQVAHTTGLSVSFLSEIERGRSQPSMGTLRKIIQALGVSLLGITAAAETPDPGNGRYTIPSGGIPPFKIIDQVTLVRGDQRKTLSYPGRPGHYELVTPDLNRNLEVLYLKMEPGADSGPEPIEDPPGEKCLLILSGEGQITINDQTYDIRAGDSLSYPAQAPVSWRVGDQSPMECLIIITPPGF